MSIRVIGVEQPVVLDANNDLVDADWLNVYFVETATTIEVTATLAFDDYAGLEAEWIAGTATTVLDTSIQQWLTGGTNIVISPPDTPPGGGGGGKGDDYQLAT